LQSTTPSSPISSSSTNHTGKKEDRFDFAKNFGLALTKEVGRGDTPSAMQTDAEKAANAVGKAIEDAGTPFNASNLTTSIAEALQSCNLLKGFFVKKTPISVTIGSNSMTAISTSDLNEFVKFIVNNISKTGTDAEFAKLKITFLALIDSASRVANGNVSANSKVTFAQSESTRVTTTCTEKPASDGQASAKGKKVFLTAEIAIEGKKAKLKTSKCTRTINIDAKKTSGCTAEADRTSLYSTELGDLIGDMKAKWLAEGAQISAQDAPPQLIVEMCKRKSFEEIEYAMYEAAKESKLNLNHEVIASLGSRIYLMARGSVSIKHGDPYGKQNCAFSSLLHNPELRKEIINKMSSGDADQLQREYENMDTRNSAVNKIAERLRGVMFDYTISELLENKGAHSLAEEYEKLKSGTGTYEYVRGKLSDTISGQLATIGAFTSDKILDIANEILEKLGLTEDCPAATSTASEVTVESHTTWPEIAYNAIASIGKMPEIEQARARFICSEVVQDFDNCCPSCCPDCSDCCSGTSLPSSSLSSPISSSSEHSRTERSAIPINVYSLSVLAKHLKKTIVTVFNSDGILMPIVSTAEASVAINPNNIEECILQLIELSPGALKMLNGDNVTKDNVGEYVKGRSIVDITLSLVKAEGNVGMLLTGGTFYSINEQSEEGSPSMSSPTSSPTSSPESPSMSSPTSPSTSSPTSLPESPMSSPTSPLQSGEEIVRRSVNQIRLQSQSNGIRFAQQFTQIALQHPEDISFAPTGSMIISKDLARLFAQTYSSQRGGAFEHSLGQFSNEHGEQLVPLAPTQLAIKEDGTIEFGELRTLQILNLLRGTIAAMPDGEQKQKLQSLCDNISAAKTKAESRVTEVDESKESEKPTEVEDKEKKAAEKPVEAEQQKDAQQGKASWGKWFARTVCDIWDAAKVYCANGLKTCTKVFNAACEFMGHKLTQEEAEKNQTPDKSAETKPQTSPSGETKDLAKKEKAKPKEDEEKKAEEKPAKEETTPQTTTADFEQSAKTEQPKEDETKEVAEKSAKEEEEEEDLSF
jgi:hypothetical protein